jgi:hypothetical protein
MHASYYIVVLLHVDRKSGFRMKKTGKKKNGITTAVFGQIMYGCSTALQKTGKSVRNQGNYPRGLYGVREAFDPWTHPYHRGFSSVHRSNRILECPPKILS